MNEARRALQRLLDMPNLHEFLAERGVDLMAAFGSAVASEGEAHDLDLAVSLRRNADLYRLVSDLIGALRFNHIDVVDLKTADVVLRAEALAGLPIYQSEVGLFARKQIAALKERMETAHLRRLDLELLAE